jgi:predicted nuclease of predicted toxin-antitoxin system
MKILLDANLSWRLVNQLKTYFEIILHVDTIIGLSNPAKDSEIWNYAKKENLIIISNDDDFYKLSVLNGFPPKVVIIRTGNQSNIYILNLLIKYKDEIQQLYNSNDYGILEII